MSDHVPGGLLRLRPLDFQNIDYQGQTMWLLRDPLTLSERQLVFPPALAQMLMFLDGTRDVAGVRDAFSRLVGAEVDGELIADTIAQLDAAFLLDNERSAEARQVRLAAYRARRYREPALADGCYPAAAPALVAALDDYGRHEAADGWPAWTGRGIISPHIDYQRGGPIYSGVWRRAAAAVAAAEVVIIFGTDHNGGPGTITPTRLPYATPHGVLPLAEDVVEAVATAVGPDFAFAEELHHENEHSIELSAVWLDHIRRAAGVAPAPLVPILVGSFQHFLANGGHPAEDERLLAAIKALRAATDGRRVLAVASVDFAHVGPAFGDNFVMDEERRRALQLADAVLLEAIGRGDAAAFYEAIAAVDDRNRICGFAPIYLLLRFLGETAGRPTGYAHCPADTADHSLVSIGGLLLD